MLYYTTLFLVFWALIYTSARFLQYYRIVKNYKDETEAVVRKISDHVPAKRRESPANDILLEYETKEKPEGAKRPVKVTKTEPYAFAEIKSVKETIIF